MRSLGAALAGALLEVPFEDPGATIVIAIQGELGAGKTTLVGGLINALGIAGAVRSPTYTLIEPYEAHGRHIYHLDLYRLADPQEVTALGIGDLLLPDTVLLIEWPERGVGALPDADLAVAITYSAVRADDPANDSANDSASELRDLTVSAGTVAGERLLKHVLGKIAASWLARGKPMQ